MPPGTRSAAPVIAFCTLTWGGDALAYRPFEGTDAAVADSGELEIELGPAEPLRDGPRPLADRAGNSLQSRDRRGLGGCPARPNRDDFGSRTGDDQPRRQWIIRQGR